MDQRLLEYEAEICRACAHPVRLRVLNFIGDEERTVSEIRREINVSGANLSQHLRVLKAAGVLNAVRRKGNVYCSRAVPEIRELCAVMDKVAKQQIRRQQLWPI